MPFALMPAEVHLNPDPGMSPPHGAPIPTEPLGPGQGIMPGGCYYPPLEHQGPLEGGYPPMHAGIPGLGDWIMSEMKEHLPWTMPSPLDCGGPADPF